MGAHVFLGQPPNSIEQWIINHKPYFAQPNSLSVIFGNIDENGTLKTIANQIEQTSLVMSGLKTVEDAALAGKFYIPAENEDVYELYGAYQSNISSISFPDIEHIGNYGLYQMFQCNYQLKEVHFPNRTIELSNTNPSYPAPAGTGNFAYAFQYCSELTSVSNIDVHCDEGASQVFQSTFEGTQIKNLDITLHASNLSGTHSMDNTFARMAMYNSQLTSLNVHIDVSGAMRIKENTFKNMVAAAAKGLASYTIDFSTCMQIPILENNTTFDAPKEKICYIKVPEALYDAWTTAPVWNEISATFIV